MMVVPEKLEKLESSFYWNEDERKEENLLLIRKSIKIENKKIP